MIESVSLSAWRNHSQRTVTFEPGLCFVLGANGSGKSALLQGLAFGLFGRLSSELDSQDAVSLGHERAGADVVLTVEGERVSATHSVDRTRRVATSSFVQVGGREAHDGVGTLERLLGADSGTLLRLLFLGEGDAYRADAADLRLGSYLAQVFTFGELPHVLANASEQRRGLTAPLRVQRSALQSSRSELAVLEEKRRELEGLLAALEREEHAAVELQRSMDLEARDADQWRTAHVELDAWSARAAEALESVGHAGADVDAVFNLLGERKSQAAFESGESAEHAARIDAALSLAQEILSALESVRDRCPLCRQSVSEDLHEQLVANQRALVGSLSDDLEVARERASVTQRAVDEAERLNETIRSLIADRPAALGPASAPRPTLEDEREELRATIDRLRADRRSGQVELDETRERLTAIEADRQAEQVVTQAFRDEALLNVLIQSVEEFTARVRESIVRPIGEELTRSWKHFRPNVSWNLVVDQSGRLAMGDGTGVRPFSSLSAGEKTVALILLRLAFISAFTRSDFVVLDEPLEHLDPRGRRLLISSLKRAIEDGLLKQIIVSTYEESLVRRLISRDEASAVYLD